MDAFSSAQRRLVLVDWVNAHLAGRQLQPISPCHAFFGSWFADRGGLAHLARRDMRRLIPWLHSVNWIAELTEDFDWFGTLSIKQRLTTHAEKLPEVSGPEVLRSARTLRDLSQCGSIAVTREIVESTMKRYFERVDRKVFRKQR